MRYTRSLISFVILTMLLGLGSLVLSTSQVKAQAPGCGVTIGKIAFPAVDTPFDFSTTGAGPAEFTLMDPSNPTRMFTMGGSTEVTVTEQVPEGWILEDIDCTETGDQITITEFENSITITCAIGPADVACNFINRRVVADVPTLSEWGLIAMAGILGIVGFMVMRRRKATA